MSTTGRPSPFRIVGGRAGTVFYEGGKRVGELGWEMLIGDVEMVIYASQCRWNSPETRPMTRAEIVDLVRLLASALPGRIEVAFGSSSQIIDPDD
ncbi:MAG: hypothetical protein ABI882_22025 [Acidobacteriota bacterium]